jgi:diguanylate cyclase (GGDEF)-like protein
VPSKSSKPPRGKRASADDGDIPSLWRDDETEFSTTDQTAVIAPKSVRSAQRPALMVLSGSSAGKVLRISTDAIVLGRSSGADLTLSDNGISRKHCELKRLGPSAFLITDLGSTNGTLVNGVCINGATELRPGDRIQLGPEAVLQFAFYDDAEEGLANTLYEAATRDPLTRALNRRAFEERLVAEVAYAARHRERLIVIAVDIDHFKVVNDTYGHAAGDAVLRDVASSIASTLRSEDVFARVGGEEFVLLGRGLSLRKGAAMAERIRKLIEDRMFGFEAHRFHVTVSSGVAELEEAGREPTGEPLLQLADTRLYAAKRQGRNRVVSTS